MGKKRKEENREGWGHTSRIRMITAANLFGLYSALRACSAMVFSSSVAPRLVVATIFLRKNRR
jgi:hypothetical protein